MRAFIPYGVACNFAVYAYANISRQ
jgi:hypothetical protein